MIKLTQRDGKGFIAIEWVVGMVLLIVPTFMLSLSLLQYPPRKSLSQVAASEAARAYVQEGNPSDAKNAANQAAKSVIDAELGVGSYDNFSDVVKVVPDPIANPSTYCPGSEIKIIVTIPMPLLANPFSDTDEPIITLNKISSSSTERIDDYSEIESDPSC